MRSQLTASLFLAILIFSSCDRKKIPVERDQYLKSWAETAIKQDIFEFVEALTDVHSTSFVAPEDRIAVFDMDGTIICEKPDYTEVAFSIYQLREKLRSDPGLADTQPYKAVVENDEQYLRDSVDRVLLTPFIGYNRQRYKDSVLQYFSTVKHPGFQRYYKDMFYTPMVELIAYLKANDFTVYISSYTQQAFIRSVAAAYLDIPEEHIIGSVVDVDFDMTDDLPRFYRQDSFLRKNVYKAETIEYHIGQSPVFVAGNSDGDLEMLNYANLVQPHMVLVVNHDDSIREYDYQKTDLLKTARQKNWKIVSMKTDFAKVFE